MKSANSWILCLLLLHAVCLQGQETTVNNEVAKLIADADDVRVVFVDDGSNDNPLTAYQSVVPAGKQALAKAFADATLTLFRDKNGSNDASVASLTYVIINVRKNGVLVGEIVIIGYLVHVIKPGDLWYFAEYADAPWTDNSVPSEKSFMERRILGLIQASVKQGGAWKKGDGSLKGFLKNDPPEP